MRTNLTPSFIAKATAHPGADRAVYWDERLPGFGLMVTATGHKSFVLQYRHNGVSRRLTIDSALSLAEARKEARKRIGEIAKGGDPLAERRKAQASERDTLQAVCEEFLKRERANVRSMGQRRAVLERLVFSTKLGARQIADIKRSDIVRLLDQVEDTRGPAMATVVLAILRRVMNWHASRSDDFRSPIIRGMARTKPKERARSRTLTDAELGAVWHTAEGWDGPWGRFIRFVLLTACRRDEAARMTWDELSGDDWVIPAARCKSKRDVVLPLSKQARAILANLPRIADCPYVFTGNGNGPLSSYSWHKKRFDKSCGVSGWRLHDLRRTARTLLSRAGVDADVAERCLGHSIIGVRGTYDRHSYREEMLHGFEALSAQIERIVNPQENVVAMARK